MTSRRTRATNRPQRSGSTISTDASDADVAAAFGDDRRLGIVNGTPSRAARSRATPATDMASGRFGLTSRSYSDVPLDAERLA